MMKTESQLLVDAIRLLKPNSEFVITSNDYQTIEWYAMEGTAPTKAQIDAAIEQVKLNDQNAADAAETQKQAVLDRLGITADEARLLLS
jgi:hypothetical protein